MGDKKDPGKFTIRFNVADPQQQAVANLLNRQGRYKAQFISLYEQGVRRFLVGGSLGVDLWSGEILLKLKEQPEYSGIELVLVLPHPGHDTRWDQRSKARMAFLLAHCAEHITVGTQANAESYYKRNRYMADHSDCLLAVYDNDST